MDHNDELAKCLAWQACEHALNTPPGVEAVYRARGHALARLGDKERTHAARVMSDYILEYFGAEGLDWSCVDPGDPLSATVVIKIRLVT